MPDNICPSCNLELLEGTIGCPRCGIPTQPSQQKSSNREGVWLAAVIGLLCVLAVGVALVGAARRPQAQQTDWLTAAERYRSKHGAVIGPERLSGEGRIFFVPVGKATPRLVDEVADYFREKLKVEITLLPAITAVERHPQRARPKSRVWAQRMLESLREERNQQKQLWVEEVLELMRREHPELVEKNAIVIGITEDDIVPQATNWEFTYGWRVHDGLALVSSARMGMAHGKFDSQLATRDMRRMVLRYLGLLYYNLPMNNDPTSVLYSDIDLDWAGDDFYESDLHPELLPWGRVGHDACLTIAYDYSKGALEPNNGIHDCGRGPGDEQTEREEFIVDFRNGLFINSKTDFYFKDSPPILFRRDYRTMEVGDRAFGWGASHSYNSFLSTYSKFPFSYVELVFGNGGHIRFHRTSTDSGLSSLTRFESFASGDYQQSQLTWDGRLFYIKLRDGRTYSYLPCSGPTPCYLIGFQDEQGNVLKIDRDQFLNLRRLKSANSQVDFSSDGGKHIVSAVDHQGHTVRYDHDASGNVETVHHPDGSVARYTYDDAHQMISASVQATRQRRPLLLFKNAYDSAGRIVRHSGPDGGDFRIVYKLNGQGEVIGTVVTASSGAVTEFGFTGSDNDYSAWYRPAPQKQ